MQEYQVHLPKERFQIIEFKQETMPGIAVINAALQGFEPKAVFAWHCSLMIQLDHQRENGMPTRKEMVLIDQFEDELDQAIKGTDPNKPNALFLGRVTWNGTRELLWRVYDAKITHEYLQERITQKNYPRPFDYRIDMDESWEKADWHLGNCG